MSVFNVINQINDNACSIVALRTISNSMLSKTIGSIRQLLRDEKNRERNTADADVAEALARVNSLDIRNEQDENARGDEHVAAVINDLGVENTRVPPEILIPQYYGVYTYASDLLETLASNPYERPMSVPVMLNFMQDNNRSAPLALAETLAEVAGCTVEDILRMDELAKADERQRFLEQRPAIEQTLSDLKDKFAQYGGSENTIDELPGVDQHQLAVKVIEGYSKAIDQTLTRALRMRRMTELSNIPLFRNAADAVNVEVKRLEKKYNEEIDAAIANGANLRWAREVMPKRPAPAKAA